VQPPKVAAVDVSKPQAGSLAALKDPNSPLSKRSIFYDLDQFDVKDEYRSLVEAHAKYLRENPTRA
jgi:peptidoglycan-associated lipoprotein